MEKQYISKDGFDKLHSELYDWKMVKRPIMVNQVSTAREHGDLSENAEYHAAKEELARIDQKILRLESMIRSAVIIDETNINTDQVRIFTRVKIRDNKRNTEKEFTLVSATEANPTEGKISHESPVGKGLMGHKAGEVVEIEIPAGTVSWTILEILPIKE